MTENFPSGLETEKEARKAFLWLLREETIRDLFEQISAIDVNARHKLLKVLLSLSPIIEKGRLLTILTFQERNEDADKSLGRHKGKRRAHLNFSSLYNHTKIFSTPQAY